MVYTSSVTKEICELSINNIALLNRATNMVLRGYDLSQSLQISAMIEALQFKLINGIVHFIYRKVNGELREAHGTLLPKVVNNNIKNRSLFSIDSIYYNISKPFK